MPAAAGPWDAMAQAGPQRPPQKRRGGLNRRRRRGSTLCRSSRNLLWPNAHRRGCRNTLLG
eukprot:11223877-Lingulodinium_polyedra.AAC.1